MADATGTDCADPPPAAAHGAAVAADATIADAAAIGCADPAAAVAHAAAAALKQQLPVQSLLRLSGHDLFMKAFCTTNLRKCS